MVGGYVHGEEGFGWDCDDGLRGRGRQQEAAVDFDEASFVCVFNWCVHRDMSRLARIHLDVSWRTLL